MAAQILAGRAGQDCGCLALQRLEGDATNLRLPVSAQAHQRTAAAGQRSEPSSRSHPIRGELGFGEPLQGGGGLLAADAPQGQGGLLDHQRRAIPSQQPEQRGHRGGPPAEPHGPGCGGPQLVISATETRDLLLQLQPRHLARLLASIDPLPQQRLGGRPTNHHGRVAQGLQQRRPPRSPGVAQHAHRREPHLQVGVGQPGDDLVQPPAGPGRAQRSHRRSPDPGRAVAQQRLDQHRHVAIPARGQPLQADDAILGPLALQIALGPLDAQVAAEQRQDEQRQGEQRQGEQRRPPRGAHLHQPAARA